MGPEQIARRFYDAFIHRRFDEMEALYHPEVRFRDAVFSFDDRRGTMRMWRRLLADPKNGTFRYEFAHQEGDVAIGRWLADYRLGGRPVHNEIESRLTVRDGAVVDHLDAFDWSTWARQAFPLGPLVDLPLVRRGLTAMIRRVVLG